MDAELRQIEDETLREIEAARGDRQALQALQVRVLGRKGLLTQILRSIAALPPERRPEAGREANRVKDRLSSALESALRDCEETARPADRIDVTLPGRMEPRGRLHPITRVTEEICAIFSQMGFERVEGPEVEKDYYNFEALNIPKNHPARDMQDTFFVSADVVLRTHTSPLQVRTMERRRPPVRVIAPGRVFRRDSDQTHTPMFHQVEGLWVDESVSFGDLKGTLTAFVQRMFDEQTALRFRPSFFPFTEPSAEVDIRCVICRGRGCRVCKETGWLEILGSGMVHPAVFENVGYDPGRYSGFAFGLGVERVAMLKYGIDDLRRFFENDLRFLAQF
ncbi:MAG: phenylalanine--tRNA ligase subunit alpha [Desulfobacterales bacterium]